MSISNYQRLKHIYPAVLKMTALAADARADGQDLRELGRHIESLWPALFGRLLGWETGFGSEETINIDESVITAWTLPISQYIEQLNEKKRREGMSCRKRQGRQAFFPAFDATCIASLLCSSDRNATRIFSIYQNAETAAHWIELDDSEFLRQYRTLVNVLARIQGECSREFHRDPIYAQAYLIQEIAELLRGETYGDKKHADVLAKIIDAHYLYNDWHELMRLSLDEIAKHHAELCDSLFKDKEEQLRVRLFKLAELSCSIPHYPERRKDITKRLAKSRCKKWLPKIQKLWNRLERENNARLKEEREAFELDQRTDQICAWELLEPSTRRT